MARLTGGQAAIECLRAESVRHVFGLIGSATMELFDALYDVSEISFIGVHDERTGVHMADGFARASGTPGVFVAGQNGPGATNLVTGLAQARAAYSPVISIAGALSSEHIYRDAFQEVDQQSLFTPITKKTWTVTQTSRVAEMMREAFRVSMSPRRGPVQLNIPRDILANSAQFGSFQSPEQYRTESLPAAPGPQIEKAASVLAAATKPVIVAGGGIKDSGECGQTVALAEFINAPIVTSPGHGDALPHDHPLNLGQMGPRGNPVASRLVQEADVILALGTRLGFNSTFYSHDYINRLAKIIQVELEPAAIGRYFPVSLGIWADAGTTAAQLTESLKALNSPSLADSWTKTATMERTTYLERRDADAALDANPIQAGALFKVLRDTLPKDTAYTLDAGTLCLQATDAMNYWMPRSLFTPLDFGLVGFSFACGLGVKLAMPDRTVVSLMGDGGFGMTLSELSTAVDHRINTITIVMNNQCWGAEKAYQRDYFDSRFIGSDVSSPPFDKIAELYGAIGFRVDRVEQIGDAVRGAMSRDRPVVIDVQIDPDALYSFRRDSFQHRAKN